MNSIFVTTSGGCCYRIKSRDGSILWKYNTKKPIFSTPCLVTGNNHLVIGNVAGIISCVDCASGDNIWNYECNNFLFSSLVAFDNLVIFGCHDRNIHILQCETSSYKVINKFEMDSEISSTPCVYKCLDTIKVVSACNSGVISMFDLDSSEANSSISLPSEVFSSVFVYKDNIYVGCRDNKLYCLNITNV